MTKAEADKPEHRSELPKPVCVTLLDGNLSELFMGLIRMLGVAGDVVSSNLRSTVGESTKPMIRLETAAEIIDQAARVLMAASSSLCPTCRSRQVRLECIIDQPTPGESAHGCV